MLWTVKKAAQYMGVKRHQVYYLVTEGKIGASKIGDTWRLDPEEIANYYKQFSKSNLFLSVKKAACLLGLTIGQIYPLLMTKKLKAIKTESIWQIEPKEVENYAERLHEKKNRKSSGNFIYCGDSGFLFSCLPDCLRTNSNRETTCMEGRRRTLVCSQKRSKALLLKKLKPIIQLELFTA